MVKITVNRPVELELAKIRVTLPVRYGDEDIPDDFPLRHGDQWNAVIDLETGIIEGWPAGRAGKLSMKVCDEGVYELLGPDGFAVSRLQDYVPDVVPGDFGDYVNLEIDSTGRITNWEFPERASDLTEFFGKDDE